MMTCLFLGDQPLVQLFLNQGIICGQLLELSIAKTVCPAVTDVSQFVTIVC